MAKPKLSQKLAGVVHIPGNSAPPSVTEADENLFCCWGSVMGDATDCTCWEPIFDLEQAPTCEPPPELPTRSKCCHDCAYRNGSPERADEYEAEALVDLARSGRGAFWCHEGMRRAVAYRHPSTGRVVPAGEGDYQPPENGRVAWKADGTIAERCAGWAAFSR